MQNKSAKIFSFIKNKEFHTPSPELVACQSDEMTRGNIDPALLWIQTRGFYLRLLPQQTAPDSTARPAQGSKVRGLAGGDSPALLRVPECLRGKELFEFIALGTQQSWHPAPSLCFGQALLQQLSTKQGRGTGRR